MAKAQRGEGNQDLLDQITQVLEKDSLVRAAVVKKLARDYPQDFLSQVIVNREGLRSLATAKFVASNKEWQE